MKTWLLLIALITAPGTAFAQATASSAAPPVTTRAILRTVSQALRAGDVPALAEIYRHPPGPATRVLAAMSLERIHHHLDKATRDAEVCEKSLIDSRPQIAFFCAVFANGNLRLSGQTHRADLAELDIVKRFTGKVPRRQIDELRRYVARRRDRPPLQVDEPSATFTIPVDTRFTGHAGTVDVEANGTRLALIVDTGSGLVTLDRKWARKLGVRLTGETGVIGGFLTRDLHVRHGVIDELRLGDATLHHVPVLVVPGKQRLIGIDILRHLGDLRVGKNGITVYGRRDKHPVCRQPMLIGSDVWGQHVRMLTALPIDGTLRTLLVDSGSGPFLSASRQAMDDLEVGPNDRVRMKDIGTRTHHARINRTTVQTIVGRQPFTLTMPVYKDARLPWGYILGYGALRYMDFYFDFSGNHACLLLHDARH